MADGALDEEGLAAEILAYFVEHPETADNLEGVAGWRLLSSRVRSSVESTDRMLALLVERGFLRKVETKTGPFFRMNPKKLRSAQDFLQERKGSRSPIIEAPGQEKETVEIRIKNQTRQLILVPLSSRETLHLAPGEISKTVPDSEISRNAKVEKMANRGMIQILRVNGKEE